MSREAVELVRRSLSAFSRGQFETAFAACDAKVEWSTAADEPDPQTYRGRADLDRFVRSLDELWEGRFDELVEFEDFIDRGDWVVVPWRARMRGRASGVVVDVTETYAVQVRDGKIIRVEEYRRTDDALARVERADRIQ